MRGKLSVEYLKELQIKQSEIFFSNLRGVRAESTAVLRLETDWISADP